jgi:hypothetical protein
VGFPHLAADVDETAVRRERIIVRPMSLSRPRLKQGLPGGLKYPQIVPVSGSNSV